VTITVSLQRIGINKARPETPFILRWELFYGGDKPRKCSFSCDDRLAAEAFRRRLADALDDGAEWSVETGLPVGVSRPSSRAEGRGGAAAPTEGPEGEPAVAEDHPALYDVAAHQHDRWSSRAGNTARTDLDGLVMTFEAMLRPDAPALPDRPDPAAPDQDLPDRKTLRRWLRDVLTPPAIRQRLADQARARDEARAARRPPVGKLTPQQRARRTRTDADRAARRAEAAAAYDRCREFYDRHGLRWSELDEAAVLRVLARLRRRTDGTAARHNTVARRVITANATFDWAVRRDLLAAGNPIRTLEKHQRPSTTIRIRPVDLRLVVSISTLVRIVETCQALGEDGDEDARRLVAYFAAVAFAMLRPAEARCLVADDFRALVTGAWGLLVLHGSVAAVGGRYTADGEVDEHRELKHREEDQTRTVRIPPFLVDVISRHLETFGLAGDDPLFVNPDGGLVSPAQIYAVWDRIKAVVFADDDVLREELDVYDCRHARFSHQLAAGDVPDADVAGWGGNTINTMRATYQGVIAAGTGDGATWLDDLQRYYDEVVPPDLQRRTVTTPQLLEHVERMGRLTTAAVTGNHDAVRALLDESQRALLPATRTVAASRRAVAADDRTVPSPAVPSAEGPPIRRGAARRSGRRGRAPVS
jgi:hypothetical protein